MPFSQQGFNKLLCSSEIFYSFLVALSFYLLFLSRTGEARTVWEVLHPAFIPVLFVATSLLLTIVLSSEKVAYKLLFVIVHSVLVHSFFSIIFPAGDLSGQQMVLGRIRLVYDNAVLHGWPPLPLGSVFSEIFTRFSGINFQAALSVVFARMFSVDLLLVHLFLVPVLWGVFTPIAVYLITYSFTQNNKAAVMASLLFSAFPYPTYFGAISVPNSLGFIFFFYAVCFMLKNLDSNEFQTTFLMLAFSFFSLMSHYLTGVMSLSFLFLALAFKAYKSEKKSSSSTARFSLAISFVVSASLLPLSFICLRFFRPVTQTVFTLDKFYELPFEEIVGLFLLGELIYGFDLKTILLVVIGSVLALLYMIYLLFKLKRNPSVKFQVHILFLFTAFLIMLVDYRILTLFMDDLPLQPERLWVFRDFLAVPFVALAICAVVSSIQTFLKAKSPPTVSIASLKGLSECSKALSKDVVLRVMGLLFTGLLFALIIFSPLLLTGWVTNSLKVAYPHVAALQTTWYELEAVKYIEENTHEKYVVIGDIWTIYAGEVIVGVNNPRAYYFAELDKTGYDLFVNMTRDPSPQWMLQAMNYTKTTVAYFIITEPRLGKDEFNSVVSRAKQNPQLTVVGDFGARKLYVFSYPKR